MLGLANVEVTHQGPSDLKVVVFALRMNVQPSASVQYPATHPGIGADFL